MQSIFSYLKNYKKEFILGPLFKLIEAIFELFVPIVMAKIIDVGISNGDIGYVLKAGLILLALAVLGLSFASVAQFLAAKASQGFGTDLRNALFKRVNALSFEQFDKIGTSSLITRINTDVNQVQLGAAMFIRLVLRAPFLVLGAITMALIIDWKLGLIFVVVTPLISITLWFIMSKAVPYYKRLQNRLDKTTAIARENLSGVRVIRAFGAEQDSKQRFEEVADELSRAAIRVGKISALLNPVTTLIMNCAIIAIIWFGASQVNIGSLTQGELIAFVNYATQIILSLVVAANLTVIFTKASASSSRIKEVLALPTEHTAIENSTAYDMQSDIAIKFERVGFSYNKNAKRVLNDISFTLKKGETLGIIGGTGSGKTTIASLAARFYTPDEGDIYIDGVNCKNLSTSQHRAKVSIALQKSLLFSGTLQENMQLAKEDATAEDISKALSLAVADFALELPDKLQSKVVRGGKNFSGGQRQRLCIARAFLKPCDLLILDDSSSALDYTTDAKLRKNLKKLKDKSVIIISQRVNSIQSCDKILVLDNGNQVGYAPHIELLKTCEQYQAIYQSQVKEA